MQPQSNVVITTSQPQPPVAMTTQQPQPVFVVPSSFQRKPEETSSSLKVIRGLAIAELVLGSLCMVVELALVVLVNGRHGFWLGNTIGEGIWCGIWVVVAGALGMPASGNTTTNRCLVTCHMAFSIIGAVFATTGFGISVGFIFGQYSVAGFSMKIVLSILSFSSIGILIASASYCCYIMPGCCQPLGYGQTQLISVSANSQQPAMMQHPGVSGIQGYPVQGYQPVFVQPGTVPTPQNVAQTKQQEALPSQGNQLVGYPPSYSQT